MPSRRIRVAPAEALRAGFEAIRDEAGVPEAFGDAALAEAREAAARSHGAERVELPFVTIDPPGSRDLDQALHIERRGSGHRVSYAIADVGAFVDSRRRARHRGARARRDGLRARREDSAAPARAVRGGGEPAARASGARRCCGRSTSTQRAS